MAVIAEILGEDFFAQVPDYEQNMPVGTVAIAWIKELSRQMRIRWRKGPQEASGQEKHRGVGKDDWKGEKKERKEGIQRRKEAKEGKLGAKEWAGKGEAHNITRIWRGDDS